MAMSIEFKISASWLAVTSWLAGLLVLLLQWWASSAEPRPDTENRGKNREPRTPETEEPCLTESARAISTEEPPSVEPWVVIHEPRERYYYTLGGGRVHKDLKCFGLRNAKKVLSSESSEILGKTRCGICFRSA